MIKFCNKCKNEQEFYEGKSPCKKCILDVNREYRKRNKLKVKLKIKEWILNNKEEIYSVYKNCPKGFQVDHIIPLQNEMVCGLHVPWNLQYLSKEENIRKHNRFDGTYENNSWRKLNP